MYQIRPDDYAAFRCLAGACPQTCCAAWEIVVDPDAQDAYLRLQHPLAAKLRRVLRVDSEGDTYFAQTDGRCPFLCADGLCELQRTLGEQSLCRTCRDFPRWEVLLCDRVEQGLSPACPEAARRLLERSVPLRFTSMLLPDDGYVPGARERRLTAAVTAVRDRILALLARPGRTAYANLAAAVLLVLVLSATVLVTVSPQVQADITRWVAEQTGNVLDFQFRGDSPAQPIPQYQITALPEGYVETERTDALDAGNVTYKNSDGDMILLDYAYMQDGALHRIILNDTDTMSDIRVSGMPGKLILSTEEKNFNRILWIDAAQNLQFTITAAAEESVIIAMAESVSLYDPTK